MAEREVRLSVAQAYDRSAPAYEGYDNPMVFGASRVIEALAGDVAGRRLIEFGCGAGRNLVRLKAAGATVSTGLDLSEGMLARARRLDPTLTLIRLDMSTPVPLGDGSADLVLFCLTLEHVERLAPPLAEAGRLLAPDGEVAVVEIHPALSAGGVAAHFRDGEEVVTMPTFPHQEADYRAAFAAAGLRVRRRRDWRPRDFGPDLPPKLLKRGPDTPLLIEFRLARA